MIRYVGNGIIVGRNANWQFARLRWRRDKGNSANCQFALQ
jgi:hypothetical protein